MRDAWHFELRGWRQIVTFDALILTLTALTFEVGRRWGCS